MDQSVSFLSLNQYCNSIVVKISELRKSWKNSPTSERTKKILTEILRCRQIYEQERFKRQELVKKVYKMWKQVKSWREAKVNIIGRLWSGVFKGFVRFPLKLLMKEEQDEFEVNRNKDLEVNLPWILSVMGFAWGRENCISDALWRNRGGSWWWTSAHIVPPRWSALHPDGSKNWSHIWRYTRSGKNEVSYLYFASLKQMCKRLRKFVGGNKA